MVLFDMIYTFTASFHSVCKRMPFLLLTILFFLALVPYTLHFVGRTPSEAYYRDGGYLMLATGDYLTPLNYDETPRLRKPVLPYWSVALSYAVLGISSFSSRLPFLLAGCGVLWLTHLLARQLGADRKGALAATAVMLSHPLLIAASLRSIPDVQLCLFITLSMVGLLGLADCETKQKRYAWAAYVGAGLAVATKGMLIVIILAVTLGVLAWRQGRSGLRRFIHPLPMATGLLIALAWYPVMFMLHGDYLLEEFWGDQAGDKFRPSLFRALGLTGVYLTMLIGVFLPWIVPAARAFVSGHQWRECGRSQRDKWIMVFAWCVALALLFSFGKRTTVRYMLPLSPPVAALIGIAITRLPAQRTLRYVHVILWGILALAACLFFLLYLRVFEISNALAFTLIAAASIALLLLLAPRGLALRMGMPRSLVAGLSVLALVPGSYVGLHPLLLPEEGSQIADTLLALEIPEEESVLITVKRSLAGRIRILTAGHIGLHWPEERKTPPVKEYRYVVVEDKKVERFGLEDRRLVETSNIFDDDALSYGDALKIIWHGDKERFKTLRKRHYVAIQKTGAQE